MNCHFRVNYIGYPLQLAIIKWHAYLTSWMYQQTIKKREGIEYSADFIINSEVND